MAATEILHLEPHGVDTYVGSGPHYPWGGLYGGQIIAQALRAATLSLGEDAKEAHSLRAYFIRRGDQTEPVCYEVDRLRNGGSFSTRRVVARQAVGAILNLEASFTAPSSGPSLTREPMPVVEGPTDAVRCLLSAPGDDLKAFDDDHFMVSLDHTVWFHEPVEPHRWHLHAFSCDRVVGDRALTSGRVYAEDGRHVATVAQEVLVRRRRRH